MKVNIFERLPHRELSVTDDQGLEFTVPFLETYPVFGEDQAPEYFTLSLDRRFAIDASQEELDKWIPFLANAMAVAAGYSSFGANSVPLNPFGNSPFLIPEGKKQTPSLGVEV